MALVAPDGAWLRVNPARCAILGYSHEALLEKRFQDITHPDDLDADLELARRVLDGRIPNYQMEKRYLHADGSVVRDEEDRSLHLAHASIGAAALDADVAPEDALRHADRAMYAVKRARRTS